MIFYIVFFNFYEKILTLNNIKENSSFRTMREYFDNDESTLKHIEEYNLQSGFIVTIPNPCLSNIENNYNFEQAINKPSKKRERLIKYKGKEQNLRQWADELGIPYYCLRSRFNNLHWTVEKAFETPYGEGNKNDN